MDIWALFGMVVAAIIGAFGLMWVTYRVLKKLKVGDNTAGLLIVAVSCIYTAYITWAITSGNIPFMSNG